MKYKFLFVALVAVVAIFYFINSKNTDQDSSVDVQTNDQNHLSSDRNEQHTLSVPKTKSTPATGPKTQATEAEQAEFRELTQMALKSLPKISDIKALPSDQRHSTPPTIIRAAAAIGELEERMKANTGLAAEGQNFYGACIKNQELAKQVRALCLYYSWRIEKNQHIPTQSTGTNDLDDLSELASKL